MSLQEFEDNHIDDQNTKGDQNQFSSPDQSNRPNKKFLLGTVQFYEDLLDSLHDMYIAVLSASGKHIEVWGNPRLQSRLGFLPADFKGKDLQETYDQQTATLLKSRLEDVLQKAEPVLFNFRTNFPAGMVWMEVNMVPLKSEKSLSSNVVAYFRDITPSMEHEVQLSHLKEKVRHLYEHGNEGIILTNPKGIVTSVNQTLNEMSGFAVDKFIGFKLSRIPLASSKNIHFLESLIQAMDDSRRTPAFEMEWTTASGLDKWSEVTVDLQYHHGRLSGMQIRMRDITERKLIEQDLMKSKQTYKIIIENANEAIAIIQEEKVVFCNSRLLDLMNVTLDDLFQRKFQHFVHPEDQAQVSRFLSEASIRSTIQGPGMYRIARGENAYRWIECKNVQIDWNDLPASLFYMYDINQRKEEEQKVESNIHQYKFIAERAAEFGQLSDTDNVFAFIAERFKMIAGVRAVLMISHEPGTNFPAIEHIDGSEEIVESLNSILKNHEHYLSGRINQELIKSLSYGNLIKYYDGLFEKGYNLFPRNTLNVIQNSLDVGGIYLLGLKHNQTVYGNAMIFMAEGHKPDHPEAFETIARFGSSALHRQHAWKQLAERERKYRHIFESYQDIYFRVDIDGTISEISPSVRKIGGYEPEEVQGRFIKEFLKKRSLIYGYTRMLLKEGSLKDKDLNLKRKNGEVFHASLNARLLHNEKGVPAGAEGFIRDISQRRMMEERYQRSEEKFRTLADFTYDWEYWISPEGEMIYMSPSCERISGYGPEEFYKNPGLLEQITYKEDQELFRNHSQVDEVENKTDVLKINYRILSRSNEIRWINHICQEVFAESGKSLGRRISNRDITEQKIAEDELRNSEVRFKTLFYESPDPVFVQDYEGIILDVNPAACNMQKMQKQELVGTSIIDLVIEKQRDTVIREFPKWITGEINHYRTVFMTAEKTEVPVEIHGSKIKFSGQNALLFIVRDITEIIEKENNLKRSVKRAEEADMLKSAFLANVSHEIRTPMNAIIGFSEILSNPELSQEERDEFINYITQGGNTLLTLIEDIIDITKIEAGQIKVNFEDTNVDSLLDELYATFLKLKNKNGKTDVELRLNKPALEEGFVISTDPNRLRQIMTNLLGNAIKFTRQGYIEFGFARRSDETIAFYVKDTGIGIPPDKIKQIFERFGQVNDPRVAEFKGTGLGLSISKKLAELLGGDLTVESIENEGSTFSLTLPVEKTVQPDRPLDKQIADRAFDWKDKLFLVAEDSILNYTFLEALFQRTGVKLLWAKNGREAVDLCQKHENIDLVLMDIKMPILNGLEAISEIKKFRPGLPIVVQTAYAMPEDRERSIAAGGDEHLTKPINAEELFNTISRYLN
ncbi:MAG: PAS domain S-box protein [Bacteroidetes bacterium]|nr:PAS domain S-box protein [Bacteroidota bacterium]